MMRSTAVAIVVLVAGFGVLPGCGDTDLSGDFSGALFQSVEALSDMVDASDVEACIEDATSTPAPCDCPGAGEMTVARTEETPTVRETTLVYGSGCREAGGLEYVGTQRIIDTCVSGEYPNCEEEDSDEGNFDMRILGECTNATSVSRPPEDGFSRVTATCAGSTQTCDVVEIGGSTILRCS